MGPELHTFLRMLGEYMRADLHDKPVTTDQITSVTIDSTVSEEHWKLIKVAVGRSLLHPNIGSGNPDEMPLREGTFHLAYILAPYFLLIPRRGKSVKLTAVKEYWKMSPKAREASMTSKHKQLFLFGEGDEV